MPIGPLALQWLTFFVLVGFMFGALFSLVREFFRRFVFSTVLFLIVYKALVNNFGHAGLQWDYQLAGCGMLGVLLGCLMRPGLGRLIGKFRQ